MRVNGLRCLAAAMMAALVQVSLASQPGTLEKTELRTETKLIPYEKVYETSRLVSAGRTRIQQKGENGKLIRTYAVTLRNGKQVSRELVSTERVEPVNELVLIGNAGFQTSRSRFSVAKVMEVTATAYDTSPQTLPRSTGRTATGRKAEFGVIAVDPRVIPLGTIVFVEGYGMAIAADTGGAIKGHKIDVCMNSRREALNWGRRKVRIHILR
jgi:3D (Asp-Asp-Asp) domain-containing protein